MRSHLLGGAVCVCVCCVCGVSYVVPVNCVGLGLDRMCAMCLAGTICAELCVCVCVHMHMPYTTALSPLLFTRAATPQLRSASCLCLYSPLFLEPLAPPPDSHDDTKQLYIISYNNQCLYIYTVYSIHIYKYYL